MRDHCAGDDWSEQLAASRIGERFESTAEGIDQTVAAVLKALLGLDLVVQDVVGDSDQ
jgi:hypothetical protein